MSASSDALRLTIGNELCRVAPPEVTALAVALAQRGGVHTAGVLYYGSALRAQDLEGVLDFYILLDRVGAWQSSRVAAMANRLLPPNVGYFEGAIDGRVLRAKYAVMSLEQFRDRMSLSSLDTTVWARFSQPCICVWARSQSDRDALTEAVSRAVITAGHWAAELGPGSGNATDFWRALFARTYATELRVEPSGRGDDIVERDASRYAQLLPQAWRTAGIDYTLAANGELSPRLDARVRRTAPRRWARRMALGKPLNIARLLKAAFTFDRAMDYVAWKIERHSGVRIELAPWQRRFPLLAAPGLYWRLRKLGVLR